MNRRQFLQYTGTGLAALALPRAAAAQQQPNILFLFADDMTYEALHALGNTEIQTPNLDRLVRGGTTFTHAYNQGGWHGAVCVASRTMITTGRFLWHARDYEERLGEEREARRLWPQMLEDSGYDTYMTGKWHVKIDPATIFDQTAHVRGGMPRDHYRTTRVGYDRPVKGEPDEWKPWDKEQGGFWEGGTHWSEVLAEDAEAFLDRAAERDNPFFMYLAFNAPHDPRQSPKSFVDRYPLEDVAVPGNFQPRYPHDSDIGCGPGLRDEDLAPFPRTEYAVKVHRQEYYAIITHMDAQIGRILDALEATGKADDTYIVFSADHGLAVGHHGLLGKQNLYDHSVRVPLTVCGPGIARDTRIDTPVYLQDIMPSTLDWAGADQPDHVAFKSLVPLLAGKTAESHDAIYGAYRNLQRMVTDGGFKLIYYPKIDVTLLFDLEQDPLEMNNLAGDPAYAERERKLWSQLLELQQVTGDPLELPARAN